MIILADRRQVGQMKFVRSREGDGGGDGTGQTGNRPGMKTHGVQTKGERAGGAIKRRG